MPLLPPDLQPPPGPGVAPLTAGAVLMSPRGIATLFLSVRGPACPQPPLMTPWGTGGGEEGERIAGTERDSIGKMDGRVSLSLSLSLFILGRLNMEK